MTEESTRAGANTGQTKAQASGRRANLAALGAVGRGPWQKPRRGRRVPFLAGGALLVIVCVMSYALVAVRLGDRVAVLAVARSVAAGQVLGVADLTQVPAANDPAVGLIPAAHVSQVVGRTAVVPLLAGTLLTRTLVGDAAFPPPGQVVASLALKPGLYPHGLPPGANVAVFVTRGATAAASSGTNAATGGVAVPEQLPAVVLGVDLAGDGAGNTVVTLLLAESDAARLAAAGPGGVVVMQTSAGGG